MKFHLMKQPVLGPAVPKTVFDNLADCSENHLKVILYILKKDTIDPIDIANNLSITLSSVNSSLWFWADKGLVRREEEQTLAKKPKEKPLTARQILQMGKTDPNVPLLVKQLQGIYGSPLNERDSGRFLNLYLRYGIPVEVILTLTMHFAPVHKGPAYTAKVIQSLYEKDGVTDGKKAEEYLAALEKRDKAYRQVCAVFSIDKDKLTTSEKTIINTWYEKLGMSPEMISMAYRQAGENGDIRYCNGILKKWSQKGYKTPEQIETDIPPRSKGEIHGNDWLVANRGKVPTFKNKEEK